MDPAITDTTEAITTDITGITRITGITGIIITKVRCKMGPCMYGIYGKIHPLLDS